MAVGPARLRPDRKARARRGVRWRWSNRFNPVVDMLAEAEANWDGVARLDRMAVDHFNCADTPLNRSGVRKTMIAAVARARQPGCKFDTIPVLEAPEGWNKSSAWAVLAGEGNFSDESIIGKASREVQEQLAGIWIHENAELAGMSKAEVETVKAFASRQVDRARPAYGHFLVDAAAALDRGRDDQRRQVPAVADRQPAVLADEGAGADRPRQLQRGAAAAVGRGGALPEPGRGPDARRGLWAAPRSSRRRAGCGIRGKRSCPIYPTCGCWIQQAHRGRQGDPRADRRAGR